MTRASNSSQYMFADGLQYARYWGACGRVDSKVLKSRLCYETFLDSLGSQCPSAPTISSNKAFLAL